MNKQFGSELEHIGFDVKESKFSKSSEQNEGNCSNKFLKQLKIVLARKMMRGIIAVAGEGGGF